MMPTATRLGVPRNRHRSHAGERSNQSQKDLASHGRNPSREPRDERHCPDTGQPVPRAENHRWSYPGAAIAGRKHLDRRGDWPAGQLLALPTSPSSGQPLHVGFEPQVVQPAVVGPSLAERGSIDAQLSHTGPQRVGIDVEERCGAAATRRPSPSLRPSPRPSPCRPPRRRRARRRAAERWWYGWAWRGSPASLRDQKS